MSADQSFFTRARRSYALKLVAASVVLVLVIGTFGVVVGTETTAKLQSDAADDQKVLTEVRADQLDSWLANVKTSARTTTAHPTVTGGNVTEINAYLSELADSERVPQGVAAVHYLNTTSMEFAASSDPSFRGISPAEQGAPFAEDPPMLGGASDAYVSEPFDIPATDFPVVAVISPVAGDADHVGVYMVDIASVLDDYSTALDGGQTTIVSPDGTYVGHPNTSKIGTDHGETPVLQRALSGETAFTEMDGGMLMAGTGMVETSWVVMTHVDSANAYGVVDKIQSDIAGLVILALVSLGLLGVTVGSDIIITLRRLSGKARAMAGGDLDVDLRTDRVDEIGVLFGSFAEMRDSLRGKIEETETAKAEAEEARHEAERAREEAEQRRHQLEETARKYQNTMAAFADGDLTARVDADADNEAMRAIGQSINEMVTDIEETVRSVKGFAQEVNAAASQLDAGATEVEDASEEVSDAVQSISAGADHQREKLEDVSGEMSTLSATAEEVAATVDDVAETTEAAADAGERGQAAAEDAVEEMATIEETTQRMVDNISELEAEMDAIDTAVEVISDIADKTNMLALNASIEAARAGDSGSNGFATVAEEIKALAEESKESAAEIESSIERVQSQTQQTVTDVTETSERVGEGVETVEEAIEQLEAIAHHAEEANRNVQEIADATDEQAQSSQAVVGLVDDVADISQETSQEASSAAAAAQQQTATLNEVSDGADDLADRADRLTSVLDRFRVSGSTNVDQPAGTNQTAATDDD